MITAEKVKQLIQSALPGSRVEVDTFSGSDHFRASVVARQFAGKSRIEQHRMVYASLGGLVGGEIHALQLETRADVDGPA